MLRDDCICGNLNEFFLNKALCHTVVGGIRNAKWKTLCFSHWGQNKPSHLCVAVCDTINVRRKISCTDLRSILRAHIIKQ